MHEIKPELPERQSLAEVTKHHLQFWEPVEDAARDERQQMHAAFNGKSVNRPVKTARQQRSDHLARRCIRMNIDRNVQRPRGLEDRPEFPIVKICAIGVRIDDGASKPEARDRPFELLGSGLRRLRRNGRERRKAVRMLAHGLTHLIVACRCKRDRGFGIEQLHPGRGEEKKLHVYSGGIHVADAPLANVQHALAHGNAAFARSKPIVAPQTLEARIIR
jgi:hypothetical protein